VSEEKTKEKKVQKKESNTLCITIVIHSAIGVSEQ
jgi:hypothetical protein